MSDRKPTYEELLKENISLKLQLSVAEDVNKIYDQIQEKNILLFEINEELRQTTDQLKKNKEELEKIENLYKIFSNNISDVLWTIDLQGQFTYVSPSACRVYGYNPSEINLITVKDVLPDESYKKHKQALALRIERENRGEITGDITIVLKQRRKNGELFWSEIISAPMRDEYNRMYGILGVSRDISGRILVEERMRKLTVAVEQNPSSIVITGIDGSIEYVNTAFTETTGYTFDDVVGKDPKLLKSGLTPEGTFRKLWTTIMAGKTWTGEFINKNKNGEIFYEQAKIAPITDSEGNICNFVAIKENITANKFSQENLKKSQERYKMLSDISLEGIVVIENGVVSDVNQSLCKISGYGREELEGADPFDKLFDSNSSAIVKEKISDDFVFPFEATAIRKNNTNYSVEVEVRQLRYKGRDIMILAMRDISYRKRVEAVLLSSLHLTGMLSKHTEKEIIEYGLEEAVRLLESKIGFFHFIDDNQKTVQLHSWTRNTLEHCSIPQMTKDYPILEAGTWMDSFHEKKAVVHNDYQNLRHKKGLPEGHFPLQRYISMPIVEGNLVKIVLGVGNKLEHYNQFDVDILALFAKTLWMVIQLKRNEQQLTEANETKAKFLSIISHDLRSPVGSISILTEMMLENIDTIDRDELFKYIKVISETSKTTFDQLENMLVWSKAQSEKLLFRKERIPVHEFLQQQVAAISYLSSKKGIKISTNFEIETELWADRNMLGTILRNLLSNAIKFTPEKGSVMVGLKGKEPGFVEISVCDTGVGIAKNRIDTLFNLVKSSSTFGTANEKGSGLGLLLVKEFAERNGGKIHVESEEGKGSCFFLQLPAN
jgi:PAS domain S-box-containing protein